jgi:hypothetical protein
VRQYRLTLTWAQHLFGEGGKQISVGVYVTFGLDLLQRPPLGL